MLTTRSKTNWGRAWLGGCACLPKRLFPFKLSTLISTSLCSRQRLRLKCSLVYDFVQNNKIKNCQVRCNYMMPNTTVENNFQLGASSDLYKTYQNKLAASPYTFKSLFMIHKENYFNYCNTYRTTWLIHHLPRPLLLVLRISAWGSPTKRFTNTNNDLKHIWDVKLDHIVQKVHKHK